jgi:metal-dependent amidase/aminoacylase/carboxypeptidase family protein
LLVEWRRTSIGTQNGVQEHRTSAVVRAAFLEAAGIGSPRVRRHGTRGILRGGRQERTVALRADMDALAVAGSPTTTTGRRTRRHAACGHDGHIAILMGAAESSRPGATHPGTSCSVPALGGASLPAGVR